MTNLVHNLGDFRIKRLIHSEFSLGSSGSVTRVSDEEAAAFRERWSFERLEGMAEYLLAQKTKEKRFPDAEWKARLELFIEASRRRIVDDLVTQADSIHESRARHIGMMRGIWMAFEEEVEWVDREEATQGYVDIDSLDWAFDNARMYYSADVDYRRKYRQDVIGRMRFGAPGPLERKPFMGRCAAGLRAYAGFRHLSDEPETDPPFIPAIIQPA